MPRREASIEVATSADELWRFLRDFESLCACIPGVERVEVADARNATLTVREKVGVVPMVLALQATIEREDPPRSLHAVARAEHLTMAIDVALQPSGRNTTLRTVFDVAGTGPLKAIVDSLFERRATERTAAFAESLGKRFAAGAAPGASTPARPAGEAQGWLARFIARMRAVFARRRA
ncbi:MAG TPA: SRPBCC domain-containing protein [Burkholderiaceae bacterium]|nr:SRPBCC domain-containing protein [Burkholderiaceae bacterium]